MNHLHFRLLLILAFCLSTLYGWTQSTNNGLPAKDTLSAPQSKTHVHSPKKAAWMSAVLPGLGQGYNHKYWKIPIVYTGFAGAGVGIYFLNKNFTYYRDEYRYRLNGETDKLKSELSSWANENVDEMRSYYLRYLEITSIALVLWYAVNIIDAVVDAHLFYFDVSDDLSFAIKPCISTNYTFGTYQLFNGIALTLKF